MVPCNREKVETSLEEPPLLLVFLPLQQTQFVVPERLFCSSLPTTTLCLMPIFHAEFHPRKHNEVWNGWIENMGSVKQSTTFTLDFHLHRKYCSRPGTWKCTECRFIPVQWTLDVIRWKTCDSKVTLYSPLLEPFNIVRSTSTSYLSHDDYTCTFS